MAMDLGGHEGVEIGMPMSSNYPSKLLSSSTTTTATVTTSDEMKQGCEVKVVKKGMRYRECQKNHAASLGGYAIDGCGEFMPSGEEGTLEALRCVACECHRNFHRREVEGELLPTTLCECAGGVIRDKKRALPSPLAFPPNTILPRPSPQMIMALNSIPSESDQDGSGGGGAGHGLLSPQQLLHMMSSGGKKRFRTKFTHEQKEKMLCFAEKVGWRIQKHDDAAVQAFCSDVGVKRQVLKVWMHNNKNTLGKKLREGFMIAPEETNMDDENTS